MQKNKSYFLTLTIALALVFSLQVKAEIFCGTSAKEQCAISSDCIISGCFQSVCKLKNLNTTTMPGVSDCLWNTCYDHRVLNYECGCFRGQCQWNATVIISPEVIIPPATSTQIISTTTVPVVATTTNNINATTTAPITTTSISFLQSEVARITALIQTLTVQLLAIKKPSLAPANGLTINMGLGGRGYQVKILQSWLSQDKAIYPEGKVTGYFGRLTLLAVKRFQTKYASEVLAPRGLIVPDGIVESYARAKLNALFAK